MIQGVRLIIYDLDGVLIDSNPAIRESILHSLKTHELDYDIESIMDLMGTPLNQIFKQLFKEEDQPRIPKAVETYREYYSEHAKDAIIVQDNVFETLDYFHSKGITQCIASNSSKELMVPILSSLGIMDYIDRFVGVDDVEKPKPDPMMIEYLILETNHTVKETVFIDDSSTGLGAGKKAGVHTVGIATGVLTTKQILEVDPDFVLTDINQLKMIIEP